MGLKNRLDEASLQIELPIPLYIDNEPAVNLAQNPISSSKSDHINRKYHKVREQAELGFIEIVHVPGSQQIADIFTKPLTKDAFPTIRDVIVKT